MHPRDVLDKILPTLPRITVHGSWSRAVGLHLLKGPPPGAPAGSPPQPLWPGGTALQGARYTPKGGFDSIYLASDPFTALKEVVAVFENPNGPPFTLRTHPWVLVTVDGVLANILDVTEAATQSALSTTLAELTGDWVYTQSLGNTPPTQLLGQAAYGSQTIVGLKYPSAKNVGIGTGFVVFPERLPDNPPSFLEVYDPYFNVGQRIP